MKTKFTLLALILTAFCGLFPATASARDCQTSGRYVTKVVGYDRCGHPVYRKVWVETRHYTPSYSYGHSHGYSRPQPPQYVGPSCRPVRPQPSCRDESKSTRGYAYSWDSYRR
jgi:hypothetical protein